MDIRELDQNFNFGNISRDDLLWLDRETPGMEMNGAADPVNFYRIAKTDASRLPYAVQCISENTAGVRLRFRTDADYIALKAVIRYTDDMSHMPRSGSSGFDLFAGPAGKPPFFRKAFMPENGRREVSGEVFLPGREERDILLNFPLYNGVQEIAVGLPPDSWLKPPSPFRFPSPVVFYGSSITQGGCASRPGNAYPAIVCRELNADMFNLGFTGNAKGEPEMAAYIAGLDMSALVLDYDYNAASAEALKATHEPFFRIIRERHPSLPILLLSKPNVDNDEAESARRRNVILQTYRQAMESGDRRVYFLDGASLFGTSYRDCCTVDGCHPNDLGFLRMAEAVLPVLRSAMEDNRTEPSHH